jgi:hypothetical protein
VSADGEEDAGHAGHDHEETGEECEEQPVETDVDGRQAVAQLGELRIER